LPSSNPARRFRDIFENAEAIARYTSGMSFAAFDADAKTRDAVERCLLRISEAAPKLGDDAETLAPTEPWHGVRALGNVLRHEYDRVRSDVLWTIITEDLPRLARVCESIIIEQRDGGQ